jgi:hypothetical protein
MMYCILCIGLCEVLSRVETRNTGCDVLHYQGHNRVGYATTNDAATDECYNEQFLSIKSGYYDERGGILSADVARACEKRGGPSRFD